MIMRQRRLPIPDISAHTFLQIDDEVDNKLSWQNQDEGYTRLVTFLFKKTPWRNKDKENLRLKITLSLLKGGRSSATVLKLAFVSQSQGSYGFIIRVHSTLKEAEKEKNNADKLDINSFDCFANCMGQAPFAGQYLVIYQDVGVNMVTESIDELCENLLKRLSSHNNEITFFAHAFQKLVKDVTESFEKIEAGYNTRNFCQYCEDIIPQLPPDLVINKACLEQSGHLIFKSQHAIFHESEPVEAISLDQLLPKVSEKNKPIQWLRLNDIW